MSTEHVRDAVRDAADHRVSPAHLHDIVADLILDVLAEIAEEGVPFEDADVHPIVDRLLDAQENDRRLVFCNVCELLADPDFCDEHGGRCADCADTTNPPDRY